MKKNSENNESNDYKTELNDKSLNLNNEIDEKKEKFKDGKNIKLTDFFANFFNKFTVPYNYLKNFIEKLDNHNIFMLSAGIAFNIIIYFIPLILIAVYLTVHFIHTRMVDTTIETFILEFLPDTENTRILLYEILTEISIIQKGSSTSGIIGFASLLWLSSLFISALRSGLDRVFEVKAKRVFIFYRLKDVFLTLFFPIIIIFYSLSIPIITFIIDKFSDFVPFVKMKIIRTWGIDIFSLLFTFVLFYLIYKFIPSSKIQSKKSIFAALIGGILVLIARWIFSWYLISMSNYGAFYGTYAAIISMAVWVYYSSFILLFSAEVSGLLCEKKT